MYRNASTPTLLFLLTIGGISASLIIRVNYFCSKAGILVFLQQTAEVTALQSTYALETELVSYAHASNSGAAILA